MAVPLVPQSISSQSALLRWARNAGSALARPLFAVVLAIIAGAIVILITSPGTLGTRLGDVVAAYQALYLGSVGNPQNLSFTLVRVGPLILTGLSVALAFRAGLFNIGAEGQLAMGAMTAGVIAFKAPFLPGWLLIILMLVGSILAGAIWGGIVGLLKAWRGAHEVVTTIMLNWIAFYFTDYLIAGPFKAPQEANQTPSLPLKATFPGIATFYNQTLGTFLPKIANPISYLADTSFFLALLALVVYWFLTSRTTFGYEIRVIGQNQKAARYAGIPIGRNLVAVMAISGAFSGLAGAIHLMGQFPYQLIGTTFSLDPTGFDAIGVALLGHMTAVGVLLSALLFGGLRQGASFMQLSANVPADLVFILQALVLFSIAAEFLPALLRAWSRLTRSRATPSTTPALASVNASANGDVTILPLPQQADGATSEAPAYSENAGATGQVSSDASDTSMLPGKEG
jgi:ABC-type uncharacterized transport system permease subunit